MGKHSVMGAGGDARGVDMEVAGRGAIQRAQIGTVRQAWEAGRLAERSPGGVQGRGYARRRARGGRVLIVTIFGRIVSNNLASGMHGGFIWECYCKKERASVRSAYWEQN